MVMRLELHSVLFRIRRTWSISRRNCLSGSARCVHVAQRGKKSDSRRASVRAFREGGGAHTLASGEGLDPNHLRGMDEHQKDIVFQVLYCADHDLIMGMVLAMAERLQKVTASEYLEPLLLRLRSTPPSLDLMRAAWILLMNVDMPTKESIVGSPKACPTQDLPHPVQRDPIQPYKGIPKVPPAKARLFFIDIRNEVIPRWLENQMLNTSDLVRLVRQSYLNS